MYGSDKDVAGGVGQDNPPHGGLGNDTLRVAGDGDSDNVYCDAGTADKAIVEVGDFVDDQEIVEGTVADVLEPLTSCEEIEIVIFR